MAKQQLLGVFEEWLILVILKLGDNAYSVAIAEAIEEATGKDVTTGSLFTTLGRLEEKSFISSYMGEVTKERGGKAKRYYRVESAGREALNETQAIRQNLESTGLVPVLA